MKNATISAQVSLYPLRQSRLTPSIVRAAAALRDAGLELETGTMSTVARGEAHRVFEGLGNAFESAAAQGDVVMVVTISNCCPAPGRSGEGG